MLMHNYLNEFDINLILFLSIRYELKQNDMLILKVRCYYAVLYVVFLQVYFIFHSELKVLRHQIVKKSINKHYFLGDVSIDFCSLFDNFTNHPNGYLRLSNGKSYECVVCSSR